MRRSLRQKKIINYLDVVQDKLPADDSYRPTKRSSLIAKNSNTPNAKESEISANDSIPSPPSPPSDDDEDYNDRSDSDFENKTPKKKVKTSVSASFLAILAASDDEDDEDEYKLQREQNVRDRLNILKTMDLGEEKSELRAKVASPIRAPVIPARKKSQRTSKSPKESTRRSTRISTRASIKSNIPFAENVFTDGTAQDEVEEVIEEKLDLASNDEDKDFFDRIRVLPQIPYNSINDFASKDFNQFSDIVKNYSLNQEPMKIIKGRITSLDFHRSENKLLVLGGDKFGHVCLWDIVMNEGISVKAHSYNTNCVSFSRDGLKFYSTSLDGTTRIGDIEHKSSTLLYKSIDEDGDDSHTTWHHEFGQSLMIAHGDGCVKLLDLRAPSEDASIYRCHKRSVRTVQINPVDDNYFLTSSGTGVFGVFDLRRASTKLGSHILSVELGKALTSAFYSAKGSFVLTTSNDDTIRIYDCRDYEADLEKFTKIPHNNHTGRWLSVFKANWQPLREDCFFVGSMMSAPKRIQAYGSNGSIFHEFNSPMMQTICSVITAHQTKPILVGGNASGKIHVYSPFQDLKNELLSLNNNEV